LCRVRFRSPRLACQRVYGSRVKETPVLKTVVELDLVGYSTLAADLEAGLDSADPVAQLNQQIQGFIDQGLAAVGAAREDRVMATTGDGAILVFDEPEAAHQFAEAVFAATNEHNARMSRPAGKRWFRMGAATGDISMQPRPGGGYEIAGATIARAVRLEAAAQPGELVIDHDTYRRLPEKEQRQFGREEDVSGKRDETFVAHRRLIGDAPAEAKQKSAVSPKPASGDRREILRLFDRLMPPEEINRLIYLLEIPIQYQPPSTLSGADRRNHVLHWAQSTPDGNQRLESELRYLVEGNSPP
jgi:class 3 adenylate cyclase